VESIADLEALEAPAIKPAAKKGKRAVEPFAEAEKIPLPVFNSQDQCAACTGIPLATIKEAKRGGCSAFKQHRVDLALLLKWLFAQDESAINWGTRLDEYKAKREKLKLDADEQKVIDRGEVTFAVGKAMATLFSNIDNQFGSLLPPVLKGLDEAGIQQRLTATSEIFKQAVREELKKFVDVDKPKSEIKT